MAEEERLGSEAAAAEDEEVVLDESATGRKKRPERDPERARRKAFATAVRSLARRPRTVVELTQLLERREYDAEVVEATLERLRELGYLDEEAVAGAVVRDAARRNLGSLRVARTLARRGVPSEIAGAAVRESGEEDLERARRLVARRWAELGRDTRLREKALRFLVGRGFPMGVARKAVGRDFDTEDF